MLGELYRQRARRQARLCEGRRLVPARGRCRRPRRHVRARHDAAVRPRRPRPTARRRSSCWRPRPSSATPRRPTIWRCSIWTATRCRRTSSAPPNCCAPPPTPATRRRNTRWRPSTRKAPACRRTSSGRCGCCRRPALADNVDAEVEYAIALFNGTGTPEEPAGGGRAAAQGGAAELADRAEPPRPRAGERTGRADGQDRRLEVAPGRQNRRQGRSRAR